MADFKIVDQKQEGSAESATHEKTFISKKSNSYRDDPTNLIVNYLPVYFTEDHLRELFSQYGHIESLIVMYNKHDYRKKSKGYGFVKFSNGEEAAAAIKGVDGTRIANKTIKVSIARPGRARRSSNVFVSRLPVNWKDEDLSVAFQEFGHIVECRVLTFGDGVSRRCGFVRYDSDEEAKNAMQKMKNYRPTPRDAPLQVNLSVNHSPDARHNMSLEKEMAMHGRDLDFMHPWMARSELYNSAMHRLSRYDQQDDFMFGGRVGGMDFSSMMHDPMHNIPFGGRSHMSASAPEFFPEDYGAAFGGGDYGASRNDNSYGAEDYGWNSKFESNRAGPKNATSAAPNGTSKKPEASTRLFVQNLPDFYEESHLKQLFSSYGEITDVTIQKDRHGNSIRCGFVTFTATDHANNALEALDGVMLSTQVLVIHVM